MIRFADADTRETVNVRLPDGRDEEQYLFGAADNICGTVDVHVAGSKKPNASRAPPLARVTSFAATGRSNNAWLEARQRSSRWLTPTCQPTS